MSNKMLNKKRRLYRYNYFRNRTLFCGRSQCQNKMIQLCCQRLNKTHAQFSSLCFEVVYQVMTLILTTFWPMRLILIASLLRKQNQYLRSIVILIDLQYRYCQFIYEQFVMQTIKSKFPPLPAYRSTQQVHPSPTIMALVGHKKYFQPKELPISKENHKQHSRESREDEPSIERELSSKRAVSASHQRNQSCQQLLKRRSDRSPLVCSFMEATDLPEVSAKSWALYEMRSERLLFGKRDYKRREMASLTKIMNLSTILDLLARYAIDAKRVNLRATKSACSMIGTTAELKQSAIYNLYDLLHGMMLPSGNDAAYLIAQFGGFLLTLTKTQPETSLHEIIYDFSSIDRLFESKPSWVNLFIKEMNLLAKNLKMKMSNFANPHGLSNTSNYSTASDLCKLTAFSMKNPQFRKIVQTQAYVYTYKPSTRQEEDKENLNPNKVALEFDKGQVKAEWRNTNKLLIEGWSGVKTGITPNAGPCLAASVAKIIGGRELEFLVILLNSESMEARWGQARRIVEWGMQWRLQR